MSGVRFKMGRQTAHTTHAPRRRITPPPAAAMHRVNLCGRRPHRPHIYVSHRLVWAPPTPPTPSCLGFAPRGIAHTAHTAHAARPGGTWQHMHSYSYVHVFMCAAVELRAIDCITQAIGARSSAIDCIAYTPGGGDPRPARSRAGGPANNFCKMQNAHATKSIATRQLPARQRS